MSIRIRSSFVLKAVMMGVLLAAGVAAVSTLVSTPAEAVAGPGVTTYYKDAKYKTVVGQEFWGCCGEYTFWGQRTIYRKFERLYCLDVLCPW